MSVFGLFFGKTGGGQHVQLSKKQKNFHPQTSLFFLPRPEARELVELEKRDLVGGFNPSEKY